MLMKTNPARFAQRAVCATMLSALVLSTVGCKTSPVQGGGSSSGSGGSTAAAPAAPLSPAEQRLRADEQRMQKSVIGAVFTGAIAGAAACALAAKLTGGSASNVRRSAATCAAIGGGLLGVDAYRHEKLRQAKNNEIDAIQAAANDVKTDNENMRTYLATTQQVLDEDRARLASLKGDVAAKRKTVAEADAERQRAETNIKSMNNALAAAKKNRSDYQQASAKFQGTIQQKSALDAQLAEMDRQVRQLETTIASYNQALTVSRA